MISMIFKFESLFVIAASFIPNDADGKHGPLLFQLLPIILLIHSMSVVLIQGKFSPLGEIWQCLEIFLVVSTGKCYWHLVSRGKGYC